MKEYKGNELESTSNLEEEIRCIMEELDEGQASSLLEGVDREETPNREYIQEIRDITFKKLGLDATATNEYDTEIEDNKKLKRNNLHWKRYVAAAAVILIVILTSFNRDRVVFALQDMISLIPGVGIIENNDNDYYKLKKQVYVNKNECTLNILYVNASKNSMTIRFDNEGFYKKKREKNNLAPPDVFLYINNREFKKLYGSSGSSFSEYSFSQNCDFTVNLDPKYINSRTKFTLVCKEFNIKANFRLQKIEQHSNLNEIGSTQSHNDISLTADAYLKDGQLSVNIYPINHSKYDLISYEDEFEFKYFGKEMILNTNKGVKDCITPSYSGTGINSPFFFDVSDGSEDFKLTIPYVVVETEEEKEITLPIPKEGEKIELNKEVYFENGTAIIKSVEKLPGDEFGYLKINFDYISPNEKQQLVSVGIDNKIELTGNTHFDEQNRLESFDYFLNASDTKELKLYLTTPRYVIMDPYQFNLNVKK
jgi:hypothetical protein